MEIRDMRVACELTQKRAAATFGVSEELVSLWERGKCGKRPDALARRREYEARLRKYAIVRGVKLAGEG